LDFDLSFGPPPEKEAFFFSGVDTLIRYNPDRETILMDTLKELGIDVTIPVAKIAFLVADDTALAKGFTLKTKEERDAIWRDYASALVGNCKIDDPDGTIVEAVSLRLRSPSIWTAFYDAKETLGSLKKLGCFVGVIANAEMSLTGALDHAGLSHFIDLVVISEEVGVEKPDPMIFQLALEKGHLRPERCVHIGNIPEIDILGARNAGITPIWLDRNRLARRIGDIRKLETLTEVEYLFPIVPHETRPGN
jgi:putative hydrolase of the HAD superfamily